MPTTAYYEKIIATMLEGLERQVLTILMNSAGINTTYKIALSSDRILNPQGMIVPVPA
jgi:ferritin-like protein